MKTKILLIAIILSLFLASCQNVPTDSNEDSFTGNGVYRDFEKASVSPGEEITVKLHINLNEDQTYYLLEDAVPAELKVVDQDKNKVKLIEIQNAVSNVQEYKVVAPEEPGEYMFSGQYALEGMDQPIEIKGETKLVVK